MTDMSRWLKKSLFSQHLFIKKYAVFVFSINSNYSFNLKYFIILTSFVELLFYPKHKFNIPNFFWTQFWHL